MNGSCHTSSRIRKPSLTKATAGAVITSEIDVAIQNWNTRAVTQCEGDAKAAHLFTINFDKYKYAPAPAEKTKMFGYAELSITMKHQDETVKIYTRTKHFPKESELNNTNGYYPDMIFDCMSFLLVSGLMYNLAMNNPEMKPKIPKHASKISKPGVSSKSKPGNGNSNGSSN